MSIFEKIFKFFVLLNIILITQEVNLQNGTEFNADIDSNDIDYCINYPYFFYIRLGEPKDATKLTLEINYENKTVFPKFSYCYLQYLSDECDEYIEFKNESLRFETDKNIQTIYAPYNSSENFLDVKISSSHCVKIQIKNLQFTNDEKKSDGGLSGGAIAVIVIVIVVLVIGAIASVVCAVIGRGRGGGSRLGGAMGSQMVGSAMACGAAMSYGSAMGMGMGMNNMQMMQNQQMMMQNQQMMMQNQQMNMQMMQNQQNAVNINPDDAINVQRHGKDDSGMDSSRKLDDESDNDSTAKDPTKYPKPGEEAEAENEDEE